MVNQAYGEPEETYPIRREEACDVCVVHKRDVNPEHECRVREDTDKAQKQACYRCAKSIGCACKGEYSLSFSVSRAY